MRLKQHVPNSGGRGFFQNAFIRIAGDQDDGGAGVALVQAARQVDAGHGRHLVVDHEAVGAFGRAGVQQRSGAAERADVEAVRFQQELQGSEHVAVVIDDIDKGCWVCRSHLESSPG